MSFEIERKFLVTKPLTEITKGRSGHTVEQCYLPKTGDWTIRVRRALAPDGKVVCTSTMKRRVSDRTCVELETPVSENYFDIVRKQGGAMLVKTRTHVEHDGHTWEVDHFLHPKLEGLVMAEIELSSEDEEFTKPDWVGKEVTHDKDYKNVRMAKRIST